MFLWIGKKGFMRGPVYDLSRRRQMITHISKAVLCVLLAAALCGCSIEASKPAPAVHEDPDGEYEALAAANNRQGISALIQDLTAVQDYTHAAAIVSAEAAALSYPVDFLALSAIFVGHEDAVKLDTWTACYLAYSRFREIEWEQELALLSAYNAVIRSYYEDDRAAFKYVLENASREFTDTDRAQLAQCGSAPNGKVLIYFPYGKNASWMLSASAALPAERIPTSLSEVEYVILIEKTRTHVGAYTNGGSAERRDYTVSLIHCPDGEVIEKSQLIVGGDPPRAINENQSVGVGEPPQPGSVASALSAALSWIG